MKYLLIMLFILVFFFTLFILLIIGYNILDIRKDPYFIRVRKELYDVETEYIIDVWIKTEKKMSSYNLSITDRERFSNLIINIIKLAKKFYLEEVISYAVSLEEECILVKPYKQWSLETLEKNIIESIERKKIENENFKKLVINYICKIEILFDKYWFDFTEEGKKYFGSKGYPDNYNIKKRGFDKSDNIKRIWAVSSEFKELGNHYVILTNQGRCYRTYWINTAYNNIKYQWEEGCCYFDFVSKPKYTGMFFDINYETFNLIELNIRAVKKLRKANFHKFDFPDFVWNWETEVFHQTDRLCWFDQFCLDNRLVNIKDLPLRYEDLPKVNELINPDILLEYVPLTYSKKIPIINEMLGMYDPEKYNP